MGISLRGMSRAEPASWLQASCTLAERSTLDHASALSPFYLGRRLILHGDRIGIQRLKLTGAAESVPDTSKVAEAAPAAEL